MVLYCHTPSLLATFGDGLFIKTNLYSCPDYLHLDVVYLTLDGEGLLFVHSFYQVYWETTLYVCRILMIITIFSFVD